MLEHLLIVEPKKEFEVFHFFARRAETFPGYFCQCDQMNSAVESLTWLVGTVNFRSSKMFLVASDSTSIPQLFPRAGSFLLLHVIKEERNKGE